MTTSVKRTLRGAALAFIVCAAWSPSAMADVVELTTGEKIVGVIKDLTSRGLVIEVRGRERTIPRRLIRSLAFGPARPTRPPSSTAKTPGAVAKPAPATAPAPGKAAPTPAESSTARGKQATAAASDTATRGKPPAAPKETAMTAPAAPKAQPVEAAAGSAKAALAPVTPTAEALRSAIVPAEPTPAPSEAKPAETTPPVPPAPPRPTIVIAKLSPSTLRDALQALFDLRAAAVPGIGSDDYAARVAQAKPPVDRYLGDGGDAQAAVKSALTTAMRLYSFAASAWSVYVDKGDFASVGRDPAIAECPRLQHAIERDAADWKFKADDPAFAGLIAGSEGLPDLWACASDRLVAAEKLLAEQTQ